MPDPSKANEQSNERPGPSEFIGRVGISPAMAMPERLTRLLLCVGLVFGLTSSTQGLALIFGFREQLWERLMALPRFPHEWLVLANLVSNLAAPALSVVGAVAGLLRKAWSRNVLNVYGIVWAVGTVLGAGAQVAAAREFPIASDNAFPYWYVAVVVGNAISSAAFPLLLIICINWPEMGVAIKDTRGLFPVLPVAGPLLPK